MLLVANAEFQEQDGCGQISQIYTQALLLHSELFEVCLVSTDGYLKIKSYSGLSERGHESIQGGGGGGGGSVCTGACVYVHVCVYALRMVSPGTILRCIFLLLLLAIIVSFVRSVTILIDPFAPDANRSELVTAAGRRVHTPCGVGLPQRSTGHHC